MQFLSLYSLEEDELGYNIPHKEETKGFGNMTPYSPGSEQPCVNEEGATWKGVLRNAMLQVSYGTESQPLQLVQYARWIAWDSVP